MDAYHALRIQGDDGGHRAGIETLPLVPPGEGEILIRTRYSGVNYKDALAGTGRGRILKRFPLTGGIDCAGEVAQSRDGRFREGDPVLITGCGLGVERDGGFAEWVLAPADLALPLPDGLGPFEAMALGTAGFTAALAIHRMERNGQHPGLGPVVVTGASGGVGTIALDILTRLGYETVAVSGKPERHGLLRELGAGRILGRNELPGGSRPLEHGVWGGALDNVGGGTLAALTRTMRPWGNIASIGLAGGSGLETTVMPFILRGVSLLGIDSDGCPHGLRRELWERLAQDMKPRHLERIVSSVIPLEGLLQVFERMLRGETWGRTVVRTAADGD